MRAIKIGIQFILFAALALLAQLAFAANTDNPNSFRVVASGGKPEIGKYQAAAAQTWKGDAVRCDLVALDAAGQVVLATASSGALLGCAAGTVSGSTAGDTVYVYDDPEQVYEAQCSGTYAITMRSTLVDFEGTTGIQEINEDAHLKGVLIAIAEKPDTEVGANSRLYVRIARHQLGGIYAGVSGGADFGALGIKADVIAESTSAAGVTIDSVLCKDGDVLVTDNNTIAIGTGSDLSCAHDATNSTCTSATGDFIVDNTDVNDQIILRLGTDTAATGIEFRNNSEAAFVQFLGSSATVFADNATLALGAGSDYSCLHNATDTICTSGTGDFVLDNTDVDDPTVIRLGTDTAATDFQVHNNSAATLFEVNGAGLTTVTGDLGVSGHVDGKVVLPSGVMFHAPATEWGSNSNNTIYSLGNLPQNQAAKTMLILFPLAVGDEIVSVNLAGTCTEAAALTLDARLVKIDKNTGAASVVGLGCAADCFTQVTVTGNWEDDEVLTAVYTVTALETYGLEITGTTGAGDSIQVQAAWLTINAKP